MTQVAQVAVCFQINSKHIKIQCEHSEQFLNVKLVGATRNQ